MNNIDINGGITMNDIKINGKKILSKNDVIEFNNIVKTMESDYKNIECLANMIENNNTVSTEGMLVESIWDGIINFFKSLCQFIINVFRSKIYSLTSRKLVEKIVKMRSNDDKFDNRLDWFKTITLTKDVLIPIHEIESLLDYVDDDQSYRITKNLKKNKISTNAIKSVKELQDRSNGTYNVTIGEALYVLSKNDEGTTLIKSEDPTERLNLLIKYLNCYSNNSTSRLKSLMRINSRCNKHLSWSIKFKERRLADEDIIDSYRISVKISNLCLNICIKSIKNVFYATNNLITDVYKPVDSTAA